MDDDAYYNYSEGNAAYNTASDHANTPASAVVTPADMHHSHHNGTGTSSSSSSNARRTSFQRFGNNNNNNTNTTTTTANNGGTPHSPAQPLPTPTPPTVRAAAHGGTRNPRRSSEERAAAATAAATALPTSSSTPSYVETPVDGVAVASGNAPLPTPPSSSAAASVGASALQSPVTMTAVARNERGRAATGETPTGVAQRTALGEATAQATASAATVTPATLTQLRSHIAHNHGLAAAQAADGGGRRLQYAQSGSNVARPEKTRTTTAATGRDRKSSPNPTSADTASRSSAPSGGRTGGRAERRSVAMAEAEPPTPHPPQLRPVVVAKSAVVERLAVDDNSGGSHTRPSSADVTNKAHGSSSGNNSDAAATRNAGEHRSSVASPSPPLGNSGVVPLLEPIRVDLCDSSNPSLTDSVGGLEGDLSLEMAEACHGFIQHLPEPWARCVVRAITLQTATLQIPPRLLRGPALFDAYAELRGEVSTLLEAAAAAAKTTRATTTSTTNNNRGTGGSGRGGGAGASAAHAKADPSLFLSVNLQHLLTVAPTILRHRLHNTRATKVEELRAGFRNNAQTAARTEASVNRYAYLPHVQRDVHFGAVLAQGEPRLMRAGPQLSDGVTPQPRSGSSADNIHSSHTNSNGVESSGRRSPRYPQRQLSPHPQQQQQRVPQTFSAQSLAPPSSTNTVAVPALTRTYSAVSFEGFPSVFLKDRFDVAQADNVSAGGAGNSNYRNSSRRRRRITPFFDRELVATLAVGQEEAALFASTLAPELMIGMPSFLKHPEKAVPLSMAASLHHLYSALTVELFLRAYTAATMKKAALNDAAAAAAASGGAAADANSNGGEGSALAARLGPGLSAGSPAVMRHNSSTHLTPGNTTVPSLLSYPASELMAGPNAATLRGPSLEVGMLYVRNTIVCNGCTPGMEAYLVFLNQIVYPELRSANGRRDGSAAAPPPPCRALVQLSEEANGSMAAPATPAVRANCKDGRPVTGAFDLPTMRHAAVEMTQLVTWVQDERSHDPRHGQPFLCNLTFVPTNVPDLAAPTLAQLCTPVVPIEMEDANAFPCAAVLATVDLWKTLPPPEVSNLLRIFYVLDRHAQRVMELESPDYATDEEAAAAAAAAAASKSHDSAEDTEAAAKNTNPVARAIPYPDPQVRQHIASTITPQIRAYVDGLAVLRRSEESPSFQKARRQRLVSFFLTRLRYYEELNERHCKSEETLQREELERMARQRAQMSGTAAATPALPSAASPAPSSSTSATPALEDAYEVRTKALGDALAVAIALEASAVHLQKTSALNGANSSNTSASAVQRGGGGGVLHGSSWLHSTPQQSHTSAPDDMPPPDLFSRDDAGAAPVAPSVVVLLIPQRDVQRR